MANLQKETYDDADRIKSDPFGWVDRDNRNHRKKQQLVFDRMAADPGECILEVGCGHGLHSRRYANQYDYTGLDLSHSLCQETRERTESPSVLQADAIELPLVDNAVRSVVGNAILHHLPDPEAALQEWLRVTNPGGSVTLTEPSYLFPKDLLETHLLPEERHKRSMAPWRLRPILQAVTPADGAWTLRPVIYTVPWPERLHGVYDRVDDLLQRVPGLRWASQMLLIHIRA